jgi:hypothetical protein
MARRFTPLSILRCSPVLLLMLLLVIGCDGSSQHSRDTADLEKRVATLDQRVKQLEAELAALRGAGSSSGGSAGPATASVADGSASAAPTGAQPAEPASPAPASAAAFADGAAGSDTATGRDAQPVAAPTAGIEVVANPQLKGSMGRIVIEFPKASKVEGAQVLINKAGDKKPAVTNYGNTVAELLPGQYELVISGARVGGAEVKARHDTRIPVGVLRISASDKNTSVAVLSADGAKQLNHDYGSRDVGLPAGKYMVKVAGQTAPVEIKAGQVTDF